jgi:hypothetical protein
MNYVPLNSWEKYQSVNNTITHIRFERSAEVNNYMANNRNPNFIKNILEHLKTKRYHIQLNDFRYDADNDVDHYIIWFNDTLSFDEARDYVNCHFKHDINVAEIVIFCNIEENKSIKFINHYHVMIRRIN